jgi:putative membrane protein
VIIGNQRPYKAPFSLMNAALQNVLIPSASDAELKSLLETGLKIFQGYEQHAEQVAAELK